MFAEGGLIGDFNSFAELYQQNEEVLGLGPAAVLMVPEFGLGTHKSAFFLIPNALFYG